MIDLSFLQFTALRSPADAQSTSAFRALQAEKNSGMKFLPFVNMPCESARPDKGEAILSIPNLLGVRMEKRRIRVIPTGFEPVTY